MCSSQTQFMPETRQAQDGRLSAIGFQPLPRNRHPDQTRKLNPKIRIASVTTTHRGHASPKCMPYSFCLLSAQSASSAILYQFDFKLSASCLPSGRNEEWGTDLRKAFGSASLWVAFDAFGDLLFFNSKKKVGKKCRSHAPRGWHSAKRFCNRTTCAGLQRELPDGCGLRDGLARCA